MKRHHTTVALVILAVCISPAACLDPTSGSTGSLADVTDVPEADAVPDTNVNPCLASCDDGDPCTDDSCDPGGQCSNTRVAGYSVVECAFDTDCDDGDPCTVDTCHVTQGQCGPEGDQCLHAPSPAAECACSPAGATEIASVLYWSEPGQEVKVAGTIAISEYLQSCDDGPCSYCEGLPAVGNGVRAIRVIPEVDPEAPWQCSTGMCEGNNQCFPIPTGVPIWLWGVAEVDPGLVGTSPSGGGGGGGAAPTPDPYLIRVAGYCIQTTPAGLVGHYQGPLTVGSGEPLAVGLTIKHKDVNGWNVTLETYKGGFEASNIAVTTGRLAFDVTLPETGELVRVKLASTGMMLAGDFPGGTLQVLRDAETGDGAP